MQTGEWTQNIFLELLLGGFAGIQMGIKTEKKETKSYGLNLIDLL